MSAESTSYSAQQPPPCSTDAACPALPKAQVTEILSTGKDKNLDRQQLAKQNGHAYGSTMVAGTGTAILGDKHGNEHQQINNFQIKQANFVLPNAPAGSPTSEEVAGERRLENDLLESIPPAQIPPESNTAGIWLVPFERTERLIGRMQNLRRWLPFYQIAGQEIGWPLLAWVV